MASKIRIKKKPGKAVSSPAGTAAKKPAEKSVNKAAKKKAGNPSAQSGGGLNIIKHETQKTPKHGDTRTASVRKLLIQKREEFLKEAKREIAKYTKGENRQLVESALDDGDWALIDLSEDISLRQLGIHRENLLKIDATLRKIQEGTYGKCEECGDDISEARLNVLPFALHCRDCQEKIEMLEEIEKKEEL